MPNKAWFKQRLKDPYLLKSRQDHYRSRAAYKLIEIIDKYNLIKSGNMILDLGAAPGSWSQIAAGRTGRKGGVLAVDLLQIKPIEGVSILQGDIRSGEIQGQIAEFATKGFDLVISDMAPDTTGRHHADTDNSVELVNIALELCLDHLKQKGSFVAKVFEGAEFKKLHQRIKSMFEFAKSFNPKASLARSREVYIVATGFNGPQ